MISALLSGCQWWCKYFQLYVHSSGQWRHDQINKMGHLAGIHLLVTFFNFRLSIAAYQILPKLRNVKQQQSLILLTNWPFRPGSVWTAWLYSMGCHLRQLNWGQKDLLLRCFPHMVSQLVLGVGRQLSWGQCYGPQFLSTRAYVAWSFSQNNGWLPRTSILREPEPCGSNVTFYDLAWKSIVSLLSYAIKTLHFDVEGEDSIKCGMGNIVIAIFEKISVTIFF